MNDADTTLLPKKTIWIASAASPAALWLSQAPIGYWPLSLISLVPYFFLASRFSLKRDRVSKKEYGIVYLFAAIYWLVSLQGLCLAHPLMFIPWTAFGLYLAVYPVAFVHLVWRINGGRFPLILCAPIIWVGLECVRNYLFTGISVLMLGHHAVDVPALIQIADLFGTYGVSFVLVMINVAVWMLIDATIRKQVSRSVVANCGVASVTVLATIVYGHYRLNQSDGEDLATFALIQRSEPIEFDHPFEREIEIFQRYAAQTAKACNATDRPIDAVVWPESMFTAAAPWRFIDDDAVVPSEFDGSRKDFFDLVDIHQRRFVDRARYVQSAFAASQPESPRPQLLVGCGVIHYSQQTDVYSGFLSVGANGAMSDWYGKTHLVMFGEYIPIAPYVPGLRSLVPPGLGIASGAGAKRFMIGDTAVSPNICIETAVERVAINQLASFEDEQIPDVVVTITNDGWFDDSDVIEHHLACAQLLAVGCRRPILSAANSGPTAWISSNGDVVERLPVGTNGSVIATPKRDSRISLYLRIGDWPARICVFAILGLFFLSRQPTSGETQA